ncbi:hypothetical protein [Inediibacterium massiliense]|uniref:hypothetical protein n=1 Tax=Inediibacterium massiliense TaxID=1658111 RepID=UPI0006B600ED|nr:hypothetical protein [Inediibacterium massiliense]
MNKIKEIIDKYMYDQSIKKYSNKYFLKDNNLFAKITTTEDIDNIIRGVEYSINYYNEIYPLHRDDIIEMEKALGKYEIAVHKILQCYDILGFKYSDTELEKLIDNICKYEDKIKEINLRRLCQD